MTRTEAIKFISLRALGNFLLLFSIYGVIATFGPSMVVEAKYRIAQARGVTYAVGDVPNEITDPIPDVTPSPAPLDEGPGFGEVLAGSTEQILVPKDTDFSIVIPKIGASAKIYPNLDPNNEAEFLPYLQRGVAHAKGTVFPGMKGNTYLFAHSTDNWWNVGRYNAIFYLLKDVKVGDEIVVFFENRRYDYVVDRTVIADPSEVSYLVNSQNTDKEELILQTCWPPGTTWKRLFVIAKPKLAEQ
jgi:LPXTG-site transpeptidase (sortase) family protein